MCYVLFLSVTKWTNKNEDSKENEKMKKQLNKSNDYSNVDMFAQVLQLTETMWTDELLHILHHYDYGFNELTIKCPELFN